MHRILILLSLFAIAATAPAAEAPAEVRDWAAGCKSTPPPVYMGAAGRMVERMKAEGLWEKCGLLLFFAAHEGTPGAFNLKGCPAGELFGGAQHVPGRGLKGNGTDAWFDTHLHLQ